MLFAQSSSIGCYYEWACKTNVSIEYFYLRRCRQLSTYHRHQNTLRDAVPVQALEHCPLLVHWPARLNVAVRDYAASRRGTVRTPLHRIVSAEILSKHQVKPDLPHKVSIQA